MKRISISLFLTLFLTVEVAHPADLPVTQVVLYKHGVGFFERAGQLAAGESARLDFDASEMNDVLKSLTISEKGGGKITGLRYDSFDPLSHTLGQFPFQIGNAQPLSGMLDQLKGARLELKFGSDTVTGVVVNGRMVAGHRQAGRARATHAHAGQRRSAHGGSERGQRHSFPRRATAAAVQGLSGSGGGSAVERKAQRVHRFQRCERARRGGQLHGANAGVEVELPADFWRRRPARAGRLGDGGQHVERGLDEGAALAGVGAADFVCEPVVPAEVSGAAGGGTGG